MLIGYTSISTHDQNLDLAILGLFVIIFKLIQKEIGT